MGQLRSLFDDENMSITTPVDEPRARKTDPDTSWNAARQVKANSMRHGILRTLIARADGLATFEIYKAMGLPSRDYVSPHMKPLERGGWVRKTGETRRNPMTSGRTECEVFIVTQKFKDHPLASVNARLPVERCSECGQVKVSRR